MCIRDRPKEVDDYQGLVEGLAIANRVLGFVNAPSLQQLMIKELSLIHI